MNRETLYLILALVGGASALLSWALAFATQRFARRIEAIDYPKGGRKIHTVPTPLLGGLGIGLIILIAFGALSLFVNVPHWSITGLMIAMVILLIGGALDDRYD
ncbi:MAG: hypothetical protein KC585_01565, partial [Candidatus Magasanikbacteria bacterium]|nr:hypothetical protein [Candidatus Magasanikbacteria bacterium]